jgi:tryptophanyl-tRNA synthetase
VCDLLSAVFDSVPAAAAAATSHLVCQEKMSKSDPNSAIFMEDMAHTAAAAAATSHLCETAGPGEDEQE